MTPGQRAIYVARSALGQSETEGPNRSPWLRQICAEVGDAYGYAWCGTFIRWAWKRAGFSEASWRGLASASTWQFVENARRQGRLRSTPVPGCAVVWNPGARGHVEVYISGSNTIGGNTGDSVREHLRDIDGAYFVVPPELEAQPEPPVTEYMLEDPAAQPRVYGPWKVKADRDRALAALPARKRATARLVRTTAGRFAFLLGPRRLYGPWSTKRARDDAQVVIQKRLGRRLRPWSRTKKGAS
jgi:hypothetical protein